MSQVASEESKDLLSTGIEKKLLKSLQEPWLDETKSTTKSFENSIMALCVLLYPLEKGFIRQEVLQNILNHLYREADSAKKEVIFELFIRFSAQEVERKLNFEKIFEIADVNFLLGKSLDLLKQVHLSKYCKEAIVKRLICVIKEYLLPFAREFAFEEFNKLQRRDFLVKQFLFEIESIEILTVFNQMLWKLSELDGDQLLTDLIDEALLIFRDIKLNNLRNSLSKFGRKIFNFAFLVSDFFNLSLLPDASRSIYDM